MVIFINDVTFAKRLIMGFSGQDHLWVMAFQPNKWLVPGIAGVVVRIS